MLKEPPMANVSHAEKNRLRSFAAIVLTPQARCPIVPGDVGLWLDGPTYKFRNADGTDSVPRIDQAAFRIAFFSGVDASAGASHVNIPELRAGDEVLFIFNISDGADGSGDFESVVTIDGQLQQAAGDLHLKNFFACFIARG
jgi:hypothetical protein